MQGKPLLRKRSANPITAQLAAIWKRNDGLEQDEVSWAKWGLRIAYTILILCAIAEVAFFLAFLFWP